MKNLLQLVTVAVLPAALALGPAVDAHGQRTKKRKTRTHVVRIDSSPQGAAIHIENAESEPIGRTPFRGRLPAGEHELILVQDGFAPLEQTITVSRKSRELYFVLQRLVATGTIELLGQSVALSGARVFVNGEDRGAAPTRVDVPPGRYLVEVRKPEYKPFSRWVQVEEAQRIALLPELEPSPVQRVAGSLLVDADVANAEVWLDGNKLADTTPTVIDDLAEGAHLVEIRSGAAQPWTQSVFIKQGRRTKVTAQLGAAVEEKRLGRLRILANVEGAIVKLDGEPVGRAPQDLTDISPGFHIIELTAEGHQPAEERITVEAGTATILKVDLRPVETTPVGTLRVSASVAGARVLIDGEEVGTAPLEREVSTGSHAIRVEKRDHAPYQARVSVVAGRTTAVLADLNQAGTLRVVTNRAGARVLVDSKEVGTTPLGGLSLEPGSYVVTVERDGHEEFEQTVAISAGRASLVRATLEPVRKIRTTEDRTIARQQSTSRGARTIERGHFAVDTGIGYPYWGEARATVGVADRDARGWDVAVGFRTLLTNWELVGATRHRFYDREPFSVAAFGELSGGAGFNGRSSFGLEAGIFGSLQFANSLVLTGRLSVETWSDRLCADGDADTLPADGPEVCTATASAEALSRAGDLAGHTVASPVDLQDRDSGARVNVGVAGEAALSDRYGVFLEFEGAPFQGERARFTDLFNKTQFESDPRYAFQLGLTVKF